MNHKLIMRLVELDKAKVLYLDVECFMIRIDMIVIVFEIRIDESDKISCD